MISVSVIVPIYGVGAFIEQCAESLFAQSLQNIEYLFVDDASPDDSIEKLERCCSMHPAIKDNIKILRHEHNMGLPAARNTGLQQATGEFIFHCDGDDWVEKDALESLYRTAKDNDADYVWCDWYLSFERNERAMPQPSYSSKEDMMKFGLLGGGMKFNVWNKLVKRSLYINNGISFPTGHSMGEDMTMIMLASKANRIAHCPKCLYHYVRTNNGAFTQSFTQKKAEDIFYNSDRVINYLSESKTIKEREINWFKLHVKFPFLIDLSNETIDIWKTHYPEANKESLSNPALNTRSKILQYLAAHNCWMIVRAYSYTFNIIFKLLYR